MSTTDRNTPLVAVPVTGELLGDRTVVRLVAEPLVPVVGQTVTHLGLTAGEPTVVGVTTARAVGFPDWPILQHPELTGQALTLAEDLAWARKNVRKGVQKAEHRINGIIDREIGTHPELLPTLLEEFARILDDAGKDAAAKRWFSRARRIETDYSLPVDPDRHRTVFLEFAERGVVGAKDLTAEAKTAVARAGDDPDARTAAYDYLLDLNAERLRGGNPPYAALLTDLTRAGKAAGKTPSTVAAGFLGLVKDTPGLDKAEMPFRTAAAKKLTKRPDLLVALFRYFPGARRVPARDRRRRGQVLRHRPQFRTHGRPARSRPRRLPRLAGRRPRHDRFPGQRHTAELPAPQRVPPSRRDSAHRPGRCRPPGDRRPGTRGRGLGDRRARDDLAAQLLLGSALAAQPTAQRACSCRWPRPGRRRRGRQPRPGRGTRR